MTGILLSKTWVILTSVRCFTWEKFLQISVVGRLNLLGNTWSCPLRTFPLTVVEWLYKLGLILTRCISCPWPLSLRIVSFTRVYACPVFWAVLVHDFSFPAALCMVECLTSTLKPPFHISTPLYRIFQKWTKRLPKAALHGAVSGLVWFSWSYPALSAPICFKTLLEKVQSSPIHVRHQPPGAYLRFQISWMKERGKTTRFSCTRLQAIMPSFNWRPVESLSL